MSLHWVVLHRVFGLDSRQLLACKTQSLSLHRVFAEGVFTLGDLHRVSLQRVYTSGFTQGVWVRQQAAAGLQKTVTVFTQGVFTLGGLQRVSSQRVYTGWFYTGYRGQTADSCYAAQHGQSLQGGFTLGVFTRVYNFKCI